MGSVRLCAAMLLIGTASFSLGASAGRPAVRGTAGAPLSLQEAVSVAVGNASPRFAVKRVGNGVVARTGALTARFDAAGAAVAAPGGEMRLALAGIGRGDTLAPPQRSRPGIDGSRVLYDRGGGVTEWYRNGPLGIEQGFTLRRRIPSRPAGRPLVVALSVSGSLTARRTGSELDFTPRPTTPSAVAIRYTGLTVADARGRRLPAHLRLEGTRLELVVDDTRAQYPITVDPFIQQGSKLVPAAGEPANSPTFGMSIALSADGSTALVGAPYDNTTGFGGSAWVFVRNGSSWTQAGPRLLGDEQSNHFGFTVALSADGSTALVGDPGANNSVGAAWVFVRDGNVWLHQGSALKGDGSPVSSFGSSVALSGDGNTAIVGNPGPANGPGSAWVFTRASDTWTVQAILTGPTRDVVTGEEPEFGFSVALSGDGNTAIVGALFDGEGSAWVFGRSGASWTQEGAKLTGTGGVQPSFGFRVALSGDGSTAIVSGYSDSNHGGAAFVFTHTGSTWTQQGPKLAGTGQSGWSVALSANGDTALIGANWAGTATLWTRSAGTWTQRATFVPNDATGEGFGTSVALSADGSLGIVGGPILSNGSGAMWTFTETAGTWSQQGAKLVPLDSGSAGVSVSLSSDGNTALVGVPYIAQQGGAWIYTRSGGVWTKGQDLLPSLPSQEDGYSVALSADGTTAIVGDPNYNARSGQVAIFARSGNTWTQQLDVTPANEENLAGGAQFGVSVALSANGNTAVVGGPGDGVNWPDGALWIFTRTAGTWDNGLKLTVGAPNGNGEYGASVALSSDGTTALVGGPNDGGNGAGAAAVFTRSGSTWTQQGPKLVPSDEDNSGGGGGFGDSVALTGDGTIAFVGAPFDGPDGEGAAWVFVRSGSTWMQQGPKLVPGDEDNTGGGGWFGFGLATDADGGVALIGAPFDSGASAGAVWVFGRSDSGWAQQGPKQVAAGEDNSGGGGLFGFSVALTPDAGTALVGAPGDGPYDAGAVWAYTAAAPAPPSGATAVGGNHQATVAFTAPAGPVTSYTVTASPGGATASGSGSPIAVGGLTNGTSYTFTVTATNSAGTSTPSAPSNRVIPTAPTVPSAPTGVSAIAGNGQATVSFTPPASDGGSAITGYIVTASPGGQIATGHGTPLTVTGLSNGTTYTFTVTATNAVGTGPASAPSQPVTPTGGGSGGSSGGGGGGGGSGGAAGITLALNPPTQTVPSGGTASFTVTVTNSGTLAIQNVQVTDSTVVGCSQNPATNPALGAIAAGGSVSYTCTLAGLTSSLTNNATVTALAANSATVVGTASASVTVGAPLTPPSSGTAGSSSTPSVPRGTSSSSTTSATLTIGGLKTIHLHTSHPSISFTIALSKAAELHLTLIDRHHKTVASWTRHETSGKHTLTLLLPLKARDAGHYTLHITQNGNPAGKTLGVTVSH
jgi:uncharacterized repeat protein (TIGR01451 family)